VKQKKDGEKLFLSTHVFGGASSVLREEKSIKTGWVGF
jgi:hypothetical protein